MKSLLRIFACMIFSLMPAAAQVDSSLGFFITSAGPGKGGNLGGLIGADAHCQKLAEAVGAGKRTWHAYLSTQASGNVAAVNAKDRIGPGPWFNAKKVRMAASVANLHSDSNGLGKRTALTEKGDTVKGRGDSPNQHDILTGSQSTGIAFAAGTDHTCNNWTSETTGGAELGHFDKQGSGANPTSWNSAHTSSGCTPANLVSTGGNGYFYCFAADGPGGTGIKESPLGPLRQLRMGTVALMNGRFRSEEGLAFRFELKERADIEVQAHSLRGTIVATLMREPMPPGAHVVRWNGRDDKGNALPQGVYLIRLLAR